jgi:hypothetical protein
MSDLMKSTYEQARTVAITALNEAHSRHDPTLRKIFDCKFCVSAAAEGTIARHFEPTFKELERLTALVESLEDIVATHADPTGDSKEDQALMFECYENWSKRQEALRAELGPEFQENDGE